MSWRTRANCKGMDPELFVAEPSKVDKANLRYQRREAAAALAVCEGCEVVAECLNDALAAPVGWDLGVRGGLVASERVRIRLRRGEPVRGAGSRTRALARADALRAGKQREVAG